MIIVEFPNASKEIGLKGFVRIAGQPRNDSLCQAGNDSR
jgi:hypothetical protein